MKNLLLIFSLFALTGVAIVMALPGFIKTVQGSDDFTLKSHAVDDFTKLTLNSAFVVDVTYSPTEKITVEAPSNLHDYIEPNVKSGTLHVKFIDTAKVSCKEPIKIHISTAQLNHFHLSGAVSVTLNNKLSTGNFSLNSSGAAAFKREMDVTKADIEMSGAASTILVGMADVADIEMSGASQLKDFGFKIGKLNADLSGASSAYITGVSSLNAKLSGASLFNYKGDPTISRMDKSGAASVKKN